MTNYSYIKALEGEVADLKAELVELSGQLADAQSELVDDAEDFLAKAPWLPAAFSATLVGLAAGYLIGAGRSSRG